MLEKDGSGSTKGVARGATRERIMDATLEAITRLGVDHFSVSDVCRYASISRQTLYRHFKNKEDLITSLAEHIQEEVESEMARNVEAAQDFASRLVAISSINPAAKAVSLLRAEPTLMLEFINERPRRSHVRQIMERALDPFLSETEERHNLLIDRKRVVETLERIQISLFLAPGGAEPDFGMQVVRSIVESVLRAPQPWALPETEE